MRSAVQSCVPLQESTANRCAFFVYRHQASLPKGVGIDMDDAESLLRIVGWRICQRWCHILYTSHTLTKNPAFLYQGMPFFCNFEGFSAHLDKKTVISLLGVQN